MNRATAAFLLTLGACGPGINDDERASRPTGGPGAVLSCDDGAPCPIAIDGACEPGPDAGDPVCVPTQQMPGKPPSPPPAAFDACAHDEVTCSFALDGTCRDGICGPQESPLCTPDCSTRECGVDGCGGTCSTCGGDSFCQADGTCSLAPCVPDCSDRQCGDDGCGSSCGSCTSGFECQAGSCVCYPACDGAQCGPDGCGGSCGSCTSGFDCQAGSCVQCTVTVTGSCMAPPGQQLACVAPPSAEAQAACAGATTGQACSTPEGAGACQAPPGDPLACAIPPPHAATTACSGKAQGDSCSYVIPRACD